MILKTGNICVKKEAIVGLFQVQNHYNKLFEKSTFNKKFNTQYLSRIIVVTIILANQKLFFFHVTAL